MENATQIALVKPEQVSVSGLVQTKPGKTGGFRLTTVSQKEFCNRVMREAASKGAPISKNQAKKAYDNYRVETAKSFSQRVGAGIMAGDIPLAGASVNKQGHLTSLKIMTQREASSLKASLTVQQLVELSGGVLTQDAALAIVNKAKAARKAAADSTVEVEATQLSAGEIDRKADEVAAEHRSVAEPIGATGTEG